MRTILIALVITPATQVWADEKKYGNKKCKEVSGAIDYLISTTPKLWSKLEKNPTMTW